MTWLAWRRHRTLFVVAVALVVGLALWMLLVVHWYDAAPFVRVGLPGQRGPRYRDLTAGSAPFRLSYQIEAIRLLLLTVPCILGVLVGVPLVAGELTAHTNRLAWTQGIGRTRWLATKWLVPGLPLVALAGGLVALTDWWTHHVGRVAFGSIAGPFAISFGLGGNSRIEPATYTVTGLVPVAYSVFAFALGCALGALLRRVTWATVASVAVYAVALFTMVTTVRPVLAPQTFVPFNAGYPAGFEEALARGATPWDLGSVARFVPGYTPPAGTRPPTAIVASCDNFVGAGDPSSIIGHCYAVHHVQAGEAFQLASHYWTLQWRESALLLAVALVLCTLAWWAVRRWRA